MKAENRQQTVSIIVPVYNAQNYLEKCVNSITGQTYRDLEIILVDDGAKDNSPAMCDAYAKADHRIQVIHKENGGLMSAWMAGAEQSSGHFLCFVDSDDWVDTCMVEEMTRLASWQSGEVICCNFLIERTNGSTECCHELMPGIYTGDDLEEVKRRLLGQERRTVSMSRCMKLFSRELIMQNMKFCNPKIRMGEDVNIVLPALCDASRVVIMEKAHYYHYFYNEISMVHKYDPRMQEGIQELIGTIHTIFQEKGIPNGQEQWQKESVWLTALSVKNELRGGRKGYAQRVREICQKEEVKEAFARYTFSPQDSVNRVLLWVMKKPDGLRCAVGKGIFAVYDGLRK